MDAVNGIRTALDAPVEVQAELEREVIEFFVRLLSMLGQPKSVGEVYGMLFVSTKPLSMEELMTHLGLSKGSVSQGLKTLRGFGAVRTVYVPGLRRDHFEAELELRRIVAGSLRDLVRPELESGRERIERVRSLAERLPEDGEGALLQQRVEALRRWERRAEDALPVLIKVLGL